MKHNPLNNILIWAILILVIVGSLFFLQFRTANVILDYEETYTVGEKLSGKLTLELSSSDQLPGDTSMIVSLTQGGKIIEVETLSLEEFIELSGIKPKTIEKDNQIFYTGKQKYEVNIDTQIDYTFTEIGGYELFFSIPSIDFTTEKQILAK